jgi:hypothetical protein
MLEASAIHHEVQPHKFAISLTTSRSHDFAGGGHFFMAKYGIRIRAAANTLVVWKPRDDHGTSLQNFSPPAVKGGNNPDPNFFQRGLAFVTSARLPGVWRRYQKAQLSQEGAAEALYGEGSPSDEIFD